MGYWLMSRKKTTDEFRQELINNNIIHEVVDEYITANTKITFKCINNHIWKTKPNDILNGHGCPSCAGLKKLTKEEINSRLTTRSVRLIGEYKSMNTKSLFTCANGHFWMSKPSNVINGKNCKQCRFVWDKTAINKKLNHDQKGFALIGEYHNYMTPVEFQCSKGHVWKAALSNVFKQENPSGCPTCAKYGFDVNKPAIGYVLKYGSFIKYGITHNLDQRLYRHKKAGAFELIFTNKFESGYLAKSWEEKMRQSFGGNYVTKDVMENGFTETLPINILPDIRNKNFLT